MNFEAISKQKEREKKGVVALKRYVISLDQGTTSSRCVIFDRAGGVVSTVQKEFKQFYPQPGWVEHDPMEIYATQYGVLVEAVAQSGINPEEVAAIGITNQRETTILWDKNTGRPVYNAIVWQCRRSAGLVEQLKEEGMGEHIQKNTGLIPDAYFSATKIKWILDHVSGVREKAQRGEILFGTVDTWLIWKMTGGKVHVTDYTNASRTMLYNIHSLCWDETLLKKLEIPSCILPRVANSSEVYGSISLGGVEVPIAGIAGDQQAALFGQACFEKGEAKNTYGTGCFLLMNTGDTVCESTHGVIATIASGIDGKITYAAEGSIFVGGAVIQWLRDELKLIDESSDSEYYAKKVENNGGVYIVPAFTGLGTPHWDMYARGTIFGLTRGSGKAHLVRAALESIAYQTYDVVKAMERDTGIPLSLLKVDGGASANNFLMQFQSDILDRRILRPKIRETTAMGAAYLAGLAVGFWPDFSAIRNIWQLDRTYHPDRSQKERENLLAGWSKAVDRAKGWAEPAPLDEAKR